MLHVVAGHLNKQIANDIGVAESTVKVHRTNLMRKMKARFASRAQPDDGHPQCEATAAVEFLS
jgi:FixJ family two-component response regulator